jgi:uncharacterized protein (DUF302 family)
MTARSIFVASLLVAVPAVAAAQSGSFADVRVVAVSATYEDAKDRLSTAIEGKGLKIDRMAQIGEMLDRTGADLGAKRRVFERAEIFEFCSARLSREMMEADPRNIVLCPYGIAVYALPGERGKAFFAYRVPSTRAGTAPVANLLRDIVKEAAE